MPFRVVHFLPDDIAECPGCGVEEYFKYLIVCDKCLSVYCTRCDYICESMRMAHEDWVCPYCPVDGGMVHCSMLKKL